MVHFKTEIQAFFPFLFQKWGFEFADLEDDHDGTVVVAQSDKLRIRFVQDRADFFLDIGRVAEPDRWVGVYEILERLKENWRLHDGYKYSNKIRPVSRSLERYFPEIQDFFSE